ncbi:hypothetical protein PDJAM_G00176260 [Pangasius djambal]|uniref:Uncharacterized protein n=1 Tax=Pangasius djambal TaxID=1691987 RepID=A0ACC5ZMQ4_9TELE|nr:hypothetical protein [Pangasius djambal]
MDIAIDDVSILNGPCPPHGLCDFEMDLCYWVNSALSIHSVAWSWTSGVSASLFAPQVDHTTNSNLGHYMAFDTKHSTYEQIAYLQSELMQPTDHACLEFWYHMDMWHAIAARSSRSLASLPFPHSSSRYRETAKRKLLCLENVKSQLDLRPLQSADTGDSFLKREVNISLQKTSPYEPVYVEHLLYNELLPWKRLSVTLCDFVSFMFADVVSSVISVSAGVFV